MQGYLHIKKFWQSSYFTGYFQTFSMYIFYTAAMISQLTVETDQMIL